MAMATQAVLSCSSSGSSLEFNGLKPNRTSLSKSYSALAIPAVRSKRGRGALGAQCGFIGSPTNLIIVTCTTLSLVAGRFGLAPSANRVALPGLKLVDRNSGLQTGDPAGFTGTDVLAFGVFGHIIGVAIVLGLKNLGSIP